MSDNQEAAQRGPGVEEAEVSFCTAIVDRIVGGGPIPASAEEPHKAMFRVLEAVKAELPTLRSAIAAHAVKAERDRLLALTPEQVVEEAAKALQLSDREAYADTQTGDEPSWEESDEKTREDYRRCVRAALPILLAPEVAKRDLLTVALQSAHDDRDAAVAKREAAEKERDEVRSLLAATQQSLAMVTDGSLAVERKLEEVREHYDVLCDFHDRASNRITAAEAERDRLRAALERAVNEMDLGHREVAYRTLRAALGGSDGRS